MTVGELREFLLRFPQDAIALTWGGIEGDDLMPAIPVDTVVDVGPSGEEFYIATPEPRKRGDWPRKRAVIL